MLIQVGNFIDGTFCLAIACKKVSYRIFILIFLLEHQTSDVIGDNLEMQLITNDNKLNYFTLC